MRPTFIAQGDSFVDRIEDATVVFFDLHSRLADYKQSDIDFILENSVPIVTFDEWDRGNMSNDDWPFPLTSQQKQVFDNGHWRLKAVHFCRLLDKTKIYPSNLYPYEKPILYEEPLCSPGELFNREYDIVYIANSAPSREAIAIALAKDERLKCKISIGSKKLPFDEFLDEHKRGKLFINSSAGGYTCERPQLLFSIAGMIRQRTDQLLANDFTHLENCLRIDSPPTKKDLDKIFEVVNNKDYLYKIYTNGVAFMKKYYTEEYMANYILSILKQEGIC